MSDQADKADKNIYSTIAAGLVAARRAPALQADGSCHFFDELVGPRMYFCSRDCRDDFERQIAAKKSWVLRIKESHLRRREIPDTFQPAARVPFSEAYFLQASSLFDGEISNFLLYHAALFPRGRNKN